MDASMDALDDSLTFDPDRDPLAAKHNLTSSATDKPLKSGTDRTSTERGDEEVQNLVQCLQEAGLDDAASLAQASPYLVESSAFSWAVFLECLLLQLLVPLSLLLPFLSLPPSKAYLRLQNMGYMGLHHGSGVYISVYIVPLLVYLAVGLYLSDRTHLQSLKFTDWEVLQLVFFRVWECCMQAWEVAGLDSEIELPRLFFQKLQKKSPTVPKTINNDNRNNNLRAHLDACGAGHRAAGPVRMLLAAKAQGVDFKSLRFTLSPGGVGGANAKAPHASSSATVERLATWQEWLVSRGAWVDVHPSHTSLTLGGAHMAAVITKEAEGHSARDVGILGSGAIMGPLLLTYTLLPGIFRMACPQFNTAADGPKCAGVTWLGPSVSSAVLCVASSLAVLWHVTRLHTRLCAAIDLASRRLSEMRVLGRLIDLRGDHTAARSPPVCTLKGSGQQQGGEGGKGVMPHLSLSRLQNVRSWVLVRRTFRHSHHRYQRRVTAFVDAGLLVVLLLATWLCVSILCNLTVAPRLLRPRIEVAYIVLLALWWLGVGYRLTTLSSDYNAASLHHQSLLRQQLFKLVTSKTFLSLSAPVGINSNNGPGFKPIADPLGQGEAGTRKAAELLAHSAELECGLCDATGKADVLGLRATHGMARVMLLAMTLVVSVTLRFVWLEEA